MKTRHGHSAIRPDYEVQSFSGGDIVHPFTVTGARKGGVSSRAVRTGKQSGFGGFIMFFAQTYPGGYPEGHWDTDVAQVEDILLPTDMLCMASVDGADDLKPATRDWPDWLYVVENLTGSPSLADLQAVYAGTYSQAVSPRRHQDVVLHVYGTSDPDMADLKASVVSTGFDTWINSLTAITLYKSSDAGAIGRWLSDMQSHLIVTHQQTLDDQVYTW